MNLQIRQLQRGDLSTAVQLMRKLTPAGQPMAPLGHAVKRVGGPGFWLLGAESGPELVGVCAVSVRGGLTRLSPLSCTPRSWQHVAPALLSAALELAVAEGPLGQLTFLSARQPRQLELLQAQGFRPGHFVSLMSLPAASAAPLALPPGWVRASSSTERGLLSERCEALLASLLPGPALRGPELTSPQEADDELVVWMEGTAARAFALCTAVDGALELRLAAVGPGAAAGERFGALLNVCEGLCADRKLSATRLCVNAASSELHDEVRTRGYRSLDQGFAMHRPQEPFFCRPGVFFVDGWR